jgi:hypothetical protein
MRRHLENTEKARSLRLGPVLPHTHTHTRHTHDTHTHTQR